MSHISYLDETWNFVTGCSGQGCPIKDSCWARAMVKRFSDIHGFFNQIGEPKVPSPVPFPFGDVHFHPDRLSQPLHWKKPRRIGVCFLGDLFDAAVPYDWIDQAISIMQDTKHTYFVLTKQPQNLVKWRHQTNAIGGGDWTHNIYWGITCCTQDDLDRMMPDLVAIPGKKWLSLEPMMGSVDLSSYLPIETIGGVEMESWPSLVVVGCHSNPKRYPCKLEWIESIANQCQRAGVPVYVKQIPIGNRCSRNPEEWPVHVRVREMP